MEKYFEEIVNKMTESQRNLNRYMEGKNVLEKMMGLKDAIGRFQEKYNIDLYVEVNRLRKIDFDSLDDIRVYTGVMIDEMVSNPEEVADMYVSKYRKYQDRLDLEETPYTVIRMSSENSGLFLNYKKYMEGMFKLWKAKYFVDVDLKYPLSEFINEREKFVRSVTEDDFYKDVVVIDPKISAWLSDFYYLNKKTDDEDMDRAVVNINSFVNTIKERGLDVDYNQKGDFNKSPLNNIIMHKKEEPFSEQFNVSYRKPLDYKPKRLVK